MAGRPPKSAGGATYDDQHHAMMDTYNDARQAGRWNVQHAFGLDAYQNFVRAAGLQASDSVLDIACGTGLAGLLACEILGGRAPNVYFADASSAFLEKAKEEAQRRHPGLQDHHFQRLTDVRNPQLRQQLKRDMGRPGGFDVVLARLFVSHFTLDTQHVLVSQLLTLLAPGGRLVFDWGVPSDSRVVQGAPSEQTVVGIRETIINAGYGDLSNWNMGRGVQISSFTTMITTSEKTRARDQLRGMVERAGGRIQAYQEDYDRTGGDNISGQLVERARNNQQPPNHPPRVQMDWERRLEAQRMLAQQGETVAAVVGSRVQFRLMFSLVAVVLRAG